MKGSVVIVSFSARKHGNCENIADRLQAIFPEAMLYRFSEFTIQPCGCCHYECFSPSGLCPQADNQEQTLMEAIVRSKMTFFVVPNYCDYPCANFFAFNERSQCYFQHRPELVEAYMEVPKKFIVVSNTGQDNFREAFRQHTNEEPAIPVFKRQKLRQSQPGRRPDDIPGSPPGRRSLRRQPEIHSVILL